MFLKLSGRLCDPIIEFEINSNRPDCFSVRGLGREVTVWF